jgi:hypothetical protein
MQGRLLFNDNEQRERAKRMGVTDLSRKYILEEMANGNRAPMHGRLDARSTWHPSTHPCLQTTRVMPIAAADRGLHDSIDDSYEK